VGPRLGRAGPRFGRGQAAGGRHTRAAPANLNIAIAKKYAIYFLNCETAGVAALT
jgi:hypothetical protein